MSDNPNNLRLLDQMKSTGLFPPDVVEQVRMLIASLPPDPSEPLLDPVMRLTKDLRDAARILTPDEARFMVDSYYAMQRDRIRAGNQILALTKSEEPHDVMAWLSEQRSVLEKSVARALDAYSGANPAGIWARSITGIGPIIAAGLLAHIDIHQAPTCGHIWRYAGLDPTSEWLGNEKASKLIDTVIANHAAVTQQRGRRMASPPTPSAPWLQWRGRQLENTPEMVATIATTLNMKVDTIMGRLLNEKTEKHDMTKKALVAVLAKRPWNASLKRLCFLIGESFVKVHNLESDVYGKVYVERKEYEQAKNERCDYRDQAVKSLAEKNYGADTDARGWYEKGMLPPARIHRRACRYAVKLFLSHFHHVMYEQTFGKPPPKPYIIEHGGHTHFLAPPNWPMK